MRYKNTTKKPIYMKIKGDWISVDPNKFIYLPVHIGIRQPGLTEKPDQLSELELWKLNKDELNDMAAKSGLDSINMYMSKPEMIEKILIFQNEKNN